MGDRANIVVRDAWPDDLGDREAVFLYTHWNGTELPETLRRALARRECWDDPTYLARILFSEMTRGDDSSTGYGISTRLTDNSYPLVVLRSESVYLLSENAYYAHGFTGVDRAEGTDVPSCTFGDIANSPGPLTWDYLEVLVDGRAVQS